MRKGKGKLGMQLISNEKARRRQFEKRRTSLLKAATDLSTLCGVDIGMIVYGPAQSDQPTIWTPGNKEVLAGLIEAFKARLCHEGRTKTYNLSDFFKEKTEKIKVDLDKLRGNAFKFKFKSPEDLKQFHVGLMVKIDAVRRRINVMKGSTTTSIFSNNYYNPVQGSVWKYEHELQPQVQVQQQQPNFVYYSASLNTYNNNNNNNNQMVGYYGGASNGMYMFDDQNSSNKYAYGSASNGAYGTGMMMERVVNAKPLMSSYNNQMMPGSCYMPPQNNEQQMPMALEWFSPNPDGSGQKLSPTEWFLKEES